MTTPEPRINKWLSNEVLDTINYESKNTERSLQQQDFRLGVSDVGHCRNKARLMMLQVPETEESDKSAAWVGTVLGDAIEQGLVKRHPDWLVQHETIFRIPSGGEINGHPDIVIPWSEELGAQIVGDLKSKDGLDAVRRYGQSQQQKFQVHMYAKGLMDEGIFDPERPTYVADIFYDRAAKGGVVQEPYVVGEWYDPDVILQIDEWINDVKYAVLHQEEASKDMPREWCASFCEHFTACRGNDTDVQGLIEDPELLAAVEMAVEGKKLQSEGRRLQDKAKIALNRLEHGGSTGEYQVRWTVVQGSSYTVNRDPYRKLDITPIKAPQRSRK